MRSHRLAVLPVLILSVVAKIDQVAEKTGETHRDATKLKGKDAPEHVDHRKVFAESFKSRRIEHKSALESIKGIAKDKRRPFLEDVLKNVRSLLQESRDTLERTAHRSDAPFPRDSPLLQGALSKLLENTALFTDLSLGFSQFFEPKVQKDRKLKTLLVWAYNYSIGTGIFDAETAAKVTLMAQQHELIEKSANFVNSYDKEAPRETKNTKKKSKKADSKQPKGEL